MTAAKPALGLTSGTVVVRDYDERWPALFTRAERELQLALGPRILSIDHVGSTAVPGLCAKPILDLLVTIEHFDDGPDMAATLEHIGYEFRPGEETPDRHYFTRQSLQGRTHHLSLARPDSRFACVTLAFRDALRADPALAARYAALKHGLALQFPRDRASYLDGKSAFVDAVLASAGITVAPRPTHRAAP